MVAIRPEGFELPIHQSVIKPQLILGLPRQLALVLYTLVLALSFPLSTWYPIPLGLFLHLIFAAAAKKDSGFWDVFRRSFRYHAFYRG